MNRGAKSCENCSLHGRHGVEATQVYTGFSGETTFACNSCHADALGILEIMRRGKSFDGFGGATYDPARDKGRLNKQLCGVLDVMCDGEWRTLRQISDATGYPEASISARLRDVRKEWGDASMEWGDASMQSENLGEGLWRYRVLVRVAA